MKNIYSYQPPLITARMIYNDGMGREKQTVDAAAGILRDFSMRLLKS
jgi:hypothetical protein